MMKKKPTKQQMEAVLHTKVTEIVSHRNYWLIKGTSGSWLAKPNRDNIHVEWWKNVDRKLRDRGFQVMPKMHQAGNWVLYHYIEGKICRYQEVTDTANIIRTLAHFHQAGQELDTPPYSQVAYLLADRLYERLSKFYGHLVRPSPVVDKRLLAIFVDYGPIFYRHGCETFQRLCEQDIVEHGYQAWTKHMLTHRDLASHNWMKDTLGNLWLIDFETADYDLQVGDLWQICSRILTEHHWDISLFVQLVTEYQGVKALTPWEKQTLVTLCCFPNEFFREMIGLLEQKEGYHLEQSLPYLEKIVQDYALWVSRVEQLSEWLQM